MEITLLEFLFRNKERPIDINKITIDDAIYMLKTGVFDEYFDREKVVKCLKRFKDNFFEEYYGKEFCPRCLSANVEEIKSYEGVKKSFRCKDCKKKFKHRGIVSTHFEDWVILKIVTGIYHGETMSKIHKDLEEELESREKEFKARTKIPSEKTLYDLGSRIADKLRKVMDFLILVVGGLKCQRIFCDDAFSRKRRKKNRGIQENLVRGKVFTKSKRKRKDGQYYYVIVILDADTRFIIEAYASKKRDKISFSVAFSQAKEKLSGMPKSVRGDKLKSMEVAAEKYFPKSKVQHFFQKLKPYEKEDLNRIERRIRDLRRTIGKRRKYGTLKVLRTYVTIAVMGINFLEPMDALGGRTPAQAIGIPYPFREVGPWEAFLEWTRTLEIILPKILKAGLRKIPGTLLSPSH